MDGVTQKFSVFDFFNLLISGTIFLFVLAICHYSQSMILFEKASNVIGDSTVLIVISLVAFVSFAFVFGAIFQTFGFFVSEKIFGFEQKCIETCLNDNGLFKNKIRRENIKKKAQNYLQLNKTIEYSNKDKYSAFFSHCEYYLHVKGLDGKAEKLRETQGLSELFCCAFWLTPEISIAIFLFQSLLIHSGYINLNFAILIYLLCFILGLIFFYRYRISCSNRIRIVLSIYDACMDIDEHENFT